MATNVDLSPELERFARKCVAEGLYGEDVSEVICSALRLLQKREKARRRFEQSLDEAVAESDRDGWLTTEQVMAEARELLRSRRG